MREPRLIVLKFGGSVLRTEGDLDAAAAEVYRWHREGWRVVAVASAYHGVTDRLAAEAERWSQGCESARAALVGAGEVRAACHLTLRLREAGLNSRYVPVSEAQLVAVGLPLSSRPRSVNRRRLHQLLTRHEVLVVPGFQALGPDGEPRLLGRGGSDLTALVLAEQLQAQRCRLVKDTHGLYESDPALPGPPPRRFEAITWDDAAALGDQVLQPRALRYARRHQRPFDFAAPGRHGGTLVGARTTQLAAHDDEPHPRRVALAGCGTVGGGVAAMLPRFPQLELAAVASRHPRRPRPELPDDVPQTDEPLSLLDHRPDVVVDTMGCPGEARRLALVCLAKGVDFVTADKDLLARHGPELRDAARQGGAELRGAAACGGGAPMLERCAQVAAAHDVVRLRGVINGTSNWILDRLDHGAGLQQAIDAAQDAGYAEADPSADVSGLDAARKLCLLAHAVWGLHLTPDQVSVRGLDHRGGLPRCRHAGSRRRLVAELRQVVGTVQATVAVREVGPGDPLHDLPGVRNRLVLEAADGQRWTVDGDGAGRVPTAHAVLADVLESVETATHALTTAVVSKVRRRA